jgi:hypothetical protein
MPLPSAMVPMARLPITSLLVNLAKPLPLYRPPPLAVPPGVLAVFALTVLLTS